MAQDIGKYLERARRHLEKNKLQEAIAEYSAALERAPGNLEALQTLGELYSRLHDSSQAARFYGLLFDRLAEQGDATKAVALYGRLLKSLPQPPARVARYAMLLQRQNKTPEAIEYYQAAAELYVTQRNASEALTCWERVAQLDADNPDVQVRLAEIAEQAGKPEVAARGYLRAGQLALASNEFDRGLELFEHAHRLTPGDRSAALFYAAAKLRQGDAAAAVALLKPFPVDPQDVIFLEVYSQGLLRTGQLDEAREPLAALVRLKPEKAQLLMELAQGYLKAGQDAKALQLLGAIKQQMFSADRQNEFAAALDRIVEAHPKSLPLAEMWSQFYSELNRETQYFEALIRVFDLNFAAGKIPRCCEVLERLLDIDPYDYRNQERAEKLQGRADPTFLRTLRAKMAKSASLVGGPATASRTSQGTGAGSAAPEGQSRQALDDLIVQAEIFLQYSLREKAIDRLQKIAQQFPGEEEQNERLRALYEEAGWSPSGTARRAAPASPAPAPSPASRSGQYSAETLRDLAKISEITRTVYRQGTPREVLAAAVQEIGKYLDVTRCLAAVAAPGRRPQMAAEYCAAGIEPASGAAVGRLLAEFAEAPSSSLGAVELQAGAATMLRELGVETALGVSLTDRDAQVPAGMLIVAASAARHWKQNESYFLQAVGDQMMVCVNHTKLRSLVRTLAVADERTGLLGRSSYLDCLLSETGRVKTQPAPLSLVILQVDHGPELLRQHGEAQFERYMEQLARALEGVIRQSDLAVKYNAWALALILPDTALATARTVAEKLRQAAVGVQPPWNHAPLKVSAAVVEAVARQDFDSEDIVTDLINRAEFALDQAQKSGGGMLVSPETARL